MGDSMKETEIQQEMRPQIYNLHQVKNQHVSLGTSLGRGPQGTVQEMKKQNEEEKKGKATLLSRKTLRATEAQLLCRAWEVGSKTSHSYQLQVQNWVMYPTNPHHHW